MGTRSSTTQVPPRALHTPNSCWSPRVAEPTRRGLGSTRSASPSARREKSSSTSFCRRRDRKSTRLNSSHGYISYAVFCLKKKKKKNRKHECQTQQVRNT